MSWVDIVPPVSVGLTFTALATLKFYGLARGIEGGRNKPTFDSLCGT